MKMEWKKIKKLEEIRSLSKENLIKVRLVYNENRYKNTPVDNGFLDIVKQRMIRVLFPHPRAPNIICQYRALKQNLTINRGVLCFDGNKIEVIHTPQLNRDYPGFNDKLKQTGLK